ncbi:hypothetical protein MIND_00560200 [Mycena indigotica]|uniref:Uncharacterized protein n=1 Tax=Mycena indigotica TaxID=2126181 RepID=A0A8H6W6I1_9AGAR|nr:uncharacterized protein MIND_00560200 [Mycena indigotica]KAF7307649.1 hypothetical protein MIND_00560200 [Mycena indigotica]
MGHLKRVVYENAVDVEMRALATHFAGPQYASACFVSRKWPVLLDTVLSSPHVPSCQQQESLVRLWLNGLKDQANVKPASAMPDNILVAVVPMTCGGLCLVISSIVCSEGGVSTSASTTV